MIDKDFVRAFVRETFKLKEPPTPDKKGDYILDSLMKRIDAVRRLRNGR